MEISKYFVVLLLFACVALMAIMFYPQKVDAAEPAVRPKQLCIYYGWPSHVNGSSGDVDAAISHFSKCDLLVIGDGIAYPAHGDHASAYIIISALRLAGKEVFGYSDLGVSTKNLPISTIKSEVDAWRTMGASGIFLDDAGYDYGVTRLRQSAIVDYIHNAGMNVFINAWEIDDVLGDLDEAGGISPSRLAAGDVYLAESWLVGDSAFQSLPAWAIKAEKALAYTRTKGVRIAGVSTTMLNKAITNDINTNKFKMGFYGAAMYNLAAWQWTDISYSADNSKLMFYDTSSWAYGSIFLFNNITHLNSYNSNLRESNTGKIIVRGNGLTYGIGEFIPK